jgi:hypothetical protein
MAKKGGGTGDGGVALPSPASLNHCLDTPPFPMVVGLLRMETAVGSSVMDPYGGVDLAIGCFWQECSE